jgi:hypothetical protein
MCRETLKGYLSGVLDGESPESITKFVDKHDPGGIRNAEQALDALRTVRVCDPACGSGAYLLGMMHELVDLRNSLLFSRKTDDEGLYVKKLEIISANLYGVDLDKFAVNIARLRLWLSLVVDDYRNPLDDPTADVSLPNLDFKIETGDSVRTPQPSTWRTGDLFWGKAVQGFSRVKSEYMRAHGARKSELKLALREARAEIVEATGRECADDFDWQVEFAEVFLPVESMVTIFGALNLGQELAAQPEPGGFDIILANPPYVRQELIKDSKPDLKRTYGDLYCGTADLYVYFYFRAVQLLKPGGMLAFISSNKWFKANYGARLREFMAGHVAIRSITDFGELPVFESAATFPMIFIARKSRARDHAACFTQVKSLDPPYPDIPALIEKCGRDLPKMAFKGANWVLADENTAAFLKKMTAAGIPLGDYVKGQIYRGILTGFNTAFVIDSTRRAELIAQDPKSAEIIKPLAVGDDIRKWRIENRSRWIIVTPIGIDIKRYPAVFAHLKQWQAQLEKRWDKGEHWWELRACAYYEAFNKPKIVIPDIAKEPRFAFDIEHFITNDTTFIIPLQDLYLLGILNSSPVWNYLSHIAAVLGDAEKSGRMRLKPIYVKKIPIPEAPAEERALIAALVQKCLDARGVGCEAWELEINERVARLYGV